MKNKWFFIICLGTLAFAVFTQSDFPRFLLGFEFLLLIALFISARLTCRGVTKTLLPPPDRVQRQQEIPVEVSLHNSTRLPISYLRTQISCKDHFTGQVQRFRGSAMLSGKESTVLRFVLQAEHCGLLTVQGEKIAVSDVLGVHSAAARFGEESWQIAVLPRLEIPETGEATPGKGIAGEGSGREPGGDSYELRAYQSGEPLRNIHWKMTAKTDQLMVREMTGETEVMDGVLLDLGTGGRPWDRDVWDGFLQTVAAFCAARLGAQRDFEVIWLDEEGQLVRFPVRREADAYAMLQALLGCKPRETSGEMDVMKEKLTHEAYSAASRIQLWSGVTGAEEAF